MTATQLDWRKLLSPIRRKEIEGEEESVGTGIGREELERDYDRILFAAPTRRLADKTQVFALETNDSVRTRLTHSHEVSNLARSIGVRLAYDHRDRVFGGLADELRVERTVPALLAAVGLAHDLGNPPFGHQGEKTIGQWCKKRGYQLPEFTEFDGNCQTFRLLTRLHILNDNFGFNLTCATLAALLKYPVFSKGLRGFKKFGLFESERDVAGQVWAQTGLGEGVRHPLAYVMEACDDIAYSVIDAEDVVKKRYASFNDLMDVLAGSTDCKTKSVRHRTLAKNEEFRRQKLSPRELTELSMQMFRVIAISEMVKSATETFVCHIDDILNADVPNSFEIVANSDVADLCCRLKVFDRDNGFLHPDVLLTELKGHNCISRTMTYIWSAIEERRNGGTRSRFGDYTYSRISENYRRVYDKNNTPSCADRLHLLCDQISGMTDRYLMSLDSELTELRSGPDRQKC